MSIQQDEAKIQRMLDDLLTASERELSRQYVKAADDITAKIAALYAKYAKDGVLTYAEMQKGKRYDALLKAIEKNIAALSAKTTPVIVGQSTDSIKTAYYGTQYSITNNIAAETSMTVLPEKAIVASVNMPVGGMTLLQRLGEERYTLLIKQRMAVTQGLIKGLSIEAMAKEIDATYGTGLSNAIRIARTESTRNTGAGQDAAYSDLESQGINIVRQWLATHDARTRDTHGALDGKIADGEGYFYIGGDRAKAPGGFSQAKNSVNCRCRIIAKLVDYEDELPQHRSYDDWKKLQGIK